MSNTKSPGQPNTLGEAMWRSVTSSIVVPAALIARLVGRNTVLYQSRSNRCGMLNADVDCGTSSAVTHGYNITKSLIVESEFWAFSDTPYSSRIGDMKAIEKVIVQRGKHLAEPSRQHLVCRNCPTNEMRG